MKKLLLLLAGCLFAGSAAFAQDTSIGEGTEQNPYGEQTPWIFKIQRTQPQAETVFYYMTKTTVTNGTDPVYTISLDVPNLDDPKQSCYYFTAIYVDEDGKQTSFAYGSRYDLPLGGASENIIVAAWGTKFVTYNNKPYIIGDSNWTGLAYVASNTNGDSTAEVYFNATTNTYKSLYTINSGASTPEYLAGLAAASFANTNTPKNSCVNKATINYTYGQVSFEAVDAVSLYIESVKPFVAPINVKVPTGVKVYKYASYDNGDLTVEALEGEIIEANTPVILKVDTPADYTFNFDGSDFEYTLQTSPRTFLSDSQYDNSGFYGVHTPHYVPANGYVFNGSEFVPATSSDIVSALNCYFVADDAPESISILFPEEKEATPGYYLGGALTAEFEDDPNPSYMFTKTEEGTYTLEVASIPKGKTFYVIYVDDKGNLSYYGSESPADTDWVSATTPVLDLKEGEIGTVNPIGLGSATDTPASYLNVTFTLTVDGTSPNTLSYTGELESEGFNLTVGNDKTTQSGTISGNSIAMQTEKDYATVFIYVPEGASNVQYALYNVTDIEDTTEEEINGLSTYADEVPEDLWQNASESTYEEGAYEANLPTGQTGTLYVRYTANEAEVTPDPYTFTVTRSVPTAVEGISVEKADGAIYNVFGQKVDETYRGIVIKNGKKYLQR